MQNKKVYLSFRFFVLLLSAINSQEENNSSGAFAVNAYFSNYFPVSAWSDYVILSLDDYIYRKNVRDRFILDVFEMEIAEIYDPEKIIK